MWPNSRGCTRGNKNGTLSFPAAPKFVKGSKKAALQTLTIPIQGMDCAECTQHVGQAISKLDGVASVDVLLASEKAIIRLDPAKVTMPALRKAVASAGDYSVPESAPSGSG